MKTNRTAETLFLLPVFHTEAQNRVRIFDKNAIMYRYYMELRIFVVGNFFRKNENFIQQSNKTRTNYKIFIKSSFF